MNSPDISQVLRNDVTTKYVDALKSGFESKPSDILEQRDGLQKMKRSLVEVFGGVQKESGSLFARDNRIIGAFERATRKKQDGGRLIEERLLGTNGERASKRVIETDASGRVERIDILNANGELILSQRISASGGSVEVTEESDYTNIGDCRLPGRRRVYRKPSYSGDIDNLDDSKIRYKQDNGRVTRVITQTDSTTTQSWGDARRERKIRQQDMDSQGRVYRMTLQEYKGNIEGGWDSEPAYSLETQTSWMPNGKDRIVESEVTTTVDSNQRSRRETTVTEMFADRKGEPGAVLHRRTLKQGGVEEAVYIEYSGKNPSRIHMYDSKKANTVVLDFNSVITYFSRYSQDVKYIQTELIQGRYPGLFIDIIMEKLNPNVRTTDGDRATYTISGPSKDITPLL